MVAIPLSIRKLDDERRLVTAVASVVTKADGTPITDAHGEIIRIAELEKAFIEAFASGGSDKGGEMHETDGGADIVQHFTFSRAERIALGFGPGPELGIVKIHVTDDELWKRVKAGELPELSIQGTAVPVAA